MNWKSLIQLLSLGLVQTKMPLYIKGYCIITLEINK